VKSLAIFTVTLLAFSLGLAQANGTDWLNGHDCGRMAGTKPHP